MKQFYIYEYDQRNRYLFFEAAEEKGLTFLTLHFDEQLKQDLEEMFILLKTYLKETMQLFTFDFHGRKTNLFLKDIYFIESSGHDVTLYTKNGKYCYRSTMKNILDNLGTETIVQFQKSFSVNLDYIKEIEKNTIILKNNEEFNIGRKFKNNVIQKYKEHFLR